ncbi:hypothetical protein CsSME_00045922 [Camellia sinensis var. sinensis]
MRNPLIEATKDGIYELVIQILGKFPYAAYGYDENGKNIIHIAVEQKDRILYEYFMKNIISKKDMLADVDNEGNTILHLAARLRTTPRVLLGCLNQMTRDICWFTRVWYEHKFLEHFLDHENINGKTARDLFEENHSNLREQSEKALKDMNNSLMVVSVLIGTVNYTALFTIPGAFNGRTGLPVLKYTNGHELNVFNFYVTLTLICSLFALIMMLSIQLSRFRSSDFYMALPMRFFCAMLTLFISLIYTVTACSQACVLEAMTHVQVMVRLTQLSSSVVLALIFVDTVYLTVTYICFAVHWSLYYKGQESLRLIF